MMSDNYNNACSDYSEYKECESMIEDDAEEILDTVGCELLIKWQEDIVRFVESALKENLPKEELCDLVESEYEAWEFSAEATIVNLRLPFGYQYSHGYGVIFSEANALMNVALHDRGIISEI